MQYYWKKKTIVSFVCAFLVTLIHLEVFKIFCFSDENACGGEYMLEKLFRNGFCVMAVPLFFIVSGASFFRNYEDFLYLKKLKTRFKSLVVPYFAWNILISCLYAILYSTPLETILGAENRFEFTPLYVFEAIFLHKRILAFWFIYNLIIFVVLTPIFNVFLKRKWSSLLLGFFLLCLPVYAKEILFKVGIWAIAPIYYFVGCFIGKYCFNWFSKELKNNWIGIVVSILSILVLLSFGKYLHTVVKLCITIVYALSFWIAMDCVCKKIELKKFMNHNFFLFAAHPFVQAILIKLFCKIFPRTAMSAIGVYILTAFLTVFLIVLIGEMLKNRLPKVYALFSGGR